MAVGTAIIAQNLLIRAALARKSAKAQRWATNESTMDRPLKNSGPSGLADAPEQ
jgi:hypothetical protein